MSRVDADSGGLDAATVAQRSICAIEAEHAAQERERSDAGRRRRRSQFADDDAITRTASLLKTRAGRHVKRAVEHRRTRAVAAHLWSQIAGMIGLVPDEPRGDPAAEVSPDGRAETAELAGQRTRDKVPPTHGGPPRNRGRQRQEDPEIAPACAIDDFVIDPPSVTAWVLRIERRTANGAASGRDVAPWND